MTKGQATCLQSLHDWMRQVGAVKVVLTKDTMELCLGEAPPPKTIIVPETADAREEREESEALSTLLYSSGASVLPFLKRNQK